MLHFEITLRISGLLYSTYDCFYFVWLPCDWAVQGENWKGFHRKTFFVLIIDYTISTVLSRSCCRIIIATRIVSLHPCLNWLLLKPRWRPKYNITVKSVMTSNNYTFNSSLLWIRALYILFWINFANSIDVSLVRS